MFWRKFKLDWPYVIGELLIVTAGVLIALAISAWNSDRLDRDVKPRLIVALFWSRLGVGHASLRSRCFIFNILLSIVRV